MTQFGLPTLHVITRALRKTPVPITFPMITETAASSPRPRINLYLSSAFETIDFRSAWEISI